MKNSKTTNDAVQAVASPPVDWLRRQLSRRAGEVHFLRQQVFPHPVQTWEPAELSSGPLSAKEVITVPVFGRAPATTCSFYVTQPFRLIGQKLFAGLQPDRSCFPEDVAMRLSLCLSPEEEIETPIVLTGASEFQLLVDIDPDLVARWAELSKEWRAKPESIPFGLILRPVHQNINE